METNGTYVMEFGHGVFGRQSGYKEGQNPHEWNQYLYKSNSPLPQKINSKKITPILPNEDSAKEGLQPMDQEENPQQTGIHQHLDLGLLRLQITKK